MIVSMPIWPGEIIDPRDYDTAPYGDGSAIGKALYDQVANGAAAVYLPAGITWTIDRPILMGHGVSGFCCPRLIGPGYTYRGNAAVHSGATIEATHSNAPAIELQGTRGAVISGFALRGANYDHVYNHNLGTSGVSGDTDPAAWLDPVLDSRAGQRYTPYAGIAIDPRSGPAPATAYADLIYPPAMGATEQYNKAPSSVVWLGRLWIGGFEAGIAIQPSDSDANGDFVSVSDTQIESSVWGISVGNSQSRNVDIQRVQMHRVYCALTNNQHGKRLGKFSGVVSDLSLQSVIQLHEFNNSALYGPLVFQSCYAEAMWRIGDISNSGTGQTGIRYQDCNFGFGLQDSDRGVPATVLNAPGPGRTKIDFVGGHINHRALMIAAPVESLSIDTSFRQRVMPVTDAGKIAHNATGGLYLTHLGQGTKADKIHARIQRFSRASGSVDNQHAVGPVSWAGKDHLSWLYATDHAADNKPGTPTALYGERVFSVAKSQSPAVIDGRELTIIFNARDEQQFLYEGGLPGDVIMDPVTNTVAIIHTRSGLQIGATIQNNYRVVDGGVEIIDQIDTTKHLWLIANCRHYSAGSEDRVLVT